MTTTASAQFENPCDHDKVLLEIQNRVLWLAVQMIHYANKVRPNPDGAKVGGHQASSASIVTIMTALYFDTMKAGDKISIKPQASPVFHAIQYLLGNLEASYLKSLRTLHGLQSYPSRTKDPDGVDFSTGSMGLGAVAPNFAALVQEYMRTHDFTSGPAHRYISLVGDAELDEGAVWEAIAEPAMNGLDNILWVVDFNRQSLDRVIPGIRYQSWKDMFSANGWQVVAAKYGSALQAAFAQPHGELLRQCIDELSNKAYQRLLRLSPAELRKWLPLKSRYPREMSELIGRWDDQELQDLFRNLGGHDFAELRRAFAQTDKAAGPRVVFAYTLKGWRLPSVGHPQNHSVLLTAEQMEELRNGLGIPAEEIWSGFQPQTPAGLLCREVSLRLKSPAHPPTPQKESVFPTSLRSSFSGKSSTQQTFGLILTSIARDLPDLAKRVVTVSPDVASSTNLGGWINKVHVWGRKEKETLPEETEPTALKWSESPIGQHIELGISENNLFMALGQLGLSHELAGELIYPIGTLYDPFVCRGLDAFSYGIYSGAKMIVAGTPSGITLSAEGGAHQSVITPAIGIELPELSYYEPCFGQELEWIMMAALENIRLRKESTYLRLTSKQVDQSLLNVPTDPAARELLREQALGGIYRLIDRRQSPSYQPGSNAVHIFVCGAMVPEAVEAGRLLEQEGIFANVFNVTGPGPLYKHFQHSIDDVMRGKSGHSDFLDQMISRPERRASLVTVIDGHPHALAWIGGALGMTTFPLGVTRFGQSGSRADLYQEYQIDGSSIVTACRKALGESITTGLAEGFSHRGEQRIKSGRGKPGKNP